MRVSIQQYQICALFQFSVFMDCDNFISFQTYLSLSKKVQNRCIVKWVFSHWLYPPQYFLLTYQTLFPAFLKTRENVELRRDIFSYSLWVLHAAIDPTGLQERQLQKRKVLIYLTCLKGVPKDYTCCVYSFFSKKRNCFCIERFSWFCQENLLQTLGKHWSVLMCHGFFCSVSDIRLCQKIPLFLSDSLME